MRLHRLTVSAFGPFAGTERVDFDALSCAGIFLFTGATGAGKTSLLDAVCFGLYGQVPGHRQAARALRSDHAPEGAHPEVVLEVTVRGRRLRITRSPQWDRPKRRGTGRTLEPAKVVVEELDSGAGWRTLSTRIDEAGQLVGGLLGLSLAQFCQVVLLPQGQFAEFLRADADKRRALLESLFDTARFAAVEAWLVGRRQAAARVLDELDRDVGQLLSRVAEVAGCELPHDLSAEDAPEWVGGLVTASRTGHEEAVLAECSASVALAHAQAEVAQAVRLRGLQERAGALRERLLSSRAAQAARDAAVAELEAARLVAPLVPLLTEVERLRGELEEARSLSLAGREVLAPVLAATGTDLRAVGALPVAAVVSDASRATRHEAGSLSRLVSQEREAVDLTRRLDALHRRAVDIQARSEEAAAWLASADRRRSGLVAARDEALTAATRSAEARLVRDGARARVEAAAARDLAAGEVATAGDRLRLLTDAHQAAREQVQQLRAARLAAMSAELAADLRDGHECPVCGSADHPRPATAAELVTVDQEEAAARLAADAEARRLDGQRKLAAWELRLAEHRIAAGGDAPLRALRGELVALEQRCSQVEEAAAGLPRAEHDLRAHDQEREGWVRARVSLDEEARGVAEQVRDQQQRASSLLDAVSTARGDDPTVAARIRRLNQLAEDLERLAEHLGGVERLEREVAAALARVSGALASSGWPSLDHAAAAVRDDERITELERVQRRHDTDLATVLDQLAEPALVAAAARPAPELELVTRAAQDAERRRDEAVALAATALDRLSSLERLTGDLSRVLSGRAPAAAAHQVADGLSRLAEGKSGDNALRMSLSAYVLAARLEQVAASASERLLRMSSGRYRLVHCAGVGSGRVRGGLELRVLDSWTGQERDPATLSGGEAFSASLALALGLADVVTAEAGGGLLETLFVDEGFGSLDEDTLDEVMSVLDDLRDGGRTVGLVSHVPDLGQRIPTQLRIDKGRQGSHVRRRDQSR